MAHPGGFWRKGRQILAGGGKRRHPGNCGCQFAVGVCRAGSLAEPMRQCDLVSIHTPLTAEMRGLIGAEALTAAKRGRILINFRDPGR